MHTLSLSPDTNSAVSNQSNLFSLINAFFEQFSLDDCTEHVWNLNVAFCGLPDSSFSDDQSRSNGASFCAGIHALLQGRHMVWEACSESETTTNEPASPIAAWSHLKPHHKREAFTFSFLQHDNDRAFARPMFCAKNGEKLGKVADFLLDTLRHYNYTQA